MACRIYRPRRPFAFSVYFLLLTSYFLLFLYVQNPFQHFQHLLRLILKPLCRRDPDQVRVIGPGGESPLVGQQRFFPAGFQPQIVAGMDVEGNIASGGGGIQKQRV